MRLTDICVDQFGSLANTAVENLSPQITVFFGSNGCGKTTFVRFLRGLLFGFRRHSIPPVFEQQCESGTAGILTDNGPRTLRRSWSTAGIEQFSVADQYEGRVTVRQDNHLPSWVSDDVFSEIFSAGYEEASRFDLLTKLCMECGSVGAADAELRQAQAALLQAKHDRDGNGVQIGVVQQISELRRRQGELQGKISLLRKPASDLPARIDQLLREIDGLTTLINRIDFRLPEIDAEIAHLEQLLAELRRRNVLPLNRQKLDDEVRAVSARKARWSEIRAMITREAGSRAHTDEITVAPDASVRSIRVIISRLEERVQTLAVRPHGADLSDTESTRDADVLRQLRSEIAALCQYFGQHEIATARHMESVQNLLVERSLADVTQMERLLDERLATLQAELARAENILTQKSVPRVEDGCRFTGHQELRTGGTSGVPAAQTVAEVEAQIRRIRSERSLLVIERSSSDESRNAKRVLLERLRQELAGAASLEELDALRARVAELDTQISLLEDQRRQLDSAEISLRKVVERLKGRSHSRVFELASIYVRRLTDGECQQLSAKLPDHLLVQTTHHAEPLTLSQLSRGTRDQVALALRLALIHEQKQSFGHVPLVLDDVFIASDDVRANAAVQLLVEIAEQGQQIVFFTCQKDVRELFLRYHVDVRTFGVEIPAPKIQPPAPVALHAWVEPRVEAKPPVATPPVVEPIVYLQPATEPPVMVESAPSTTPTNWLFYLEVDHGVEDLAGVTLGELEGLRSAGILTIDDLLSHSVPQLEEKVRKRGFLLSVDRLHALRGQAELTTRVPMLRRSDAALLFAAGIQTAEELSRLRPETVYDRVSHFQRSEAGSRYRRGGRLIDRQQAINWARFGQVARSLAEARGSRSRFATRSAPKSLTPGDHRPDPSSGSTLSATKTAPRTLRRRRRLTADQNTGERRARRLARRQRQVSRLRKDTEKSHDEELAPVERSGGMRFFLSRTSEIEKAPSIGPRTAEMMEAIGVRTVEDFLSMAPDRLAEKLNHRRITAPVIRQWQAQSRLMCQTPELRGHDAQILVACDITTPEDLASQKPAELYAIVKPFSATKEGERIIRGGRKPDLAEVTEWIQWAANARALRAA